MGCTFYKISTTNFIKGATQTKYGLTHINCFRLLQMSNTRTNPAKRQSLQKIKNTSSRRMDFDPVSALGAAYNRKPYKRVDGRTDRPSWRLINAHPIRCDAPRS
jgi:hypothetical protein